MLRDREVFEVVEIVYTHEIVSAEAAHHARGQLAKQARLRIRPEGEEFTYLARMDMIEFCNWLFQTEDSHAN